MSAIEGTLRDWFAVMAPVRPWTHETDPMPSQPASPKMPSTEMPLEEYRALADPILADYNARYKVYRAELGAWDVRQEAIWRYAYADAMLAARGAL